MLGSTGIAQALSSNDLNSIIDQTPFYDPDAANACGVGGTVNISSGSGLPTGATFPDLDPTAMATAINTYIKQFNPASKLSGLGSTIVADAKNSNINPFLIIAIAQKETSLADPTTYNVEHANNAFSREAISSQPNYPGAGINANTLWYKWTSVEASVDYTAAENQNVNGGGDFAAYLRAEYGTRIEADGIVGLMEAYAPPGDNNTQLYIEQINSWVSSLVSLTTSGGTSISTTTPEVISPTTSSNSCGNVDCNTSSNSVLSQTRQNVVCIAERELATWESQPGYPWNGTNNYSTNGYLKYSQGAAEQWCADFASWVYDQAGYPLDPEPNWRVSYVPNIQAIAELNQSFHWHDSTSGYTPKPGDLADYGGGHVNIVIGVVGNNVTFIGGDQGNGPYPGGSIVSQVNFDGYFSSGITGYVSPD